MIDKQTRAHIIAKPTNGPGGLKAVYKLNKSQAATARKNAARVMENAIERRDEALAAAESLDEGCRFIANLITERRRSARGTKR